MNTSAVIGLVLDLEQHGWLATTDAWIGKQAGQALWNKIQRRSKRSNLCVQLDELAARIENALPAAATALMHALDVDPLVNDLVTVLIARTTTSISEPLADLAERLRLIGVYLCAATNRLPTCRCLRSLAEPLTEEALTEALNATQGVRP